MLNFILESLQATKDLESSSSQEMMACKRSHIATTILSVSLTVRLDPHDASGAR